MEHELIREQGSLEFRVHVGLTGAEPRQRQYSEPGKLYLPVTLKFTLSSTGICSPHPRYKDLKTSSVSLFGYALKKDGKPGTREVNETIYSFTDAPDWITDIISEHTMRLREGRA